MSLWGTQSASSGGQKNPCSQTWLEAGATVALSRGALSLLGWAGYPYRIVGTGFSGWESIGLQVWWLHCKAFIFLWFLQTYSTPSYITSYCHIPALITWFWQPGFSVSGDPSGFLTFDFLYFWKFWPLIFPLDSECSNLGLNFLYCYFPPLYLWPLPWPWQNRPGASSWGWMERGLLQPSHAREHYVLSHNNSNLYFEVLELSNGECGWLGNWVIAGAVLKETGSLVNSDGMSTKQEIYIKRHT